MSDPTVLFARAPWCGTCRAMTPTLESVARDVGVRVVTVEVDEDPELVRRLGLHSVPTLVAHRDGAEVGRLTGAQTRVAIEHLFATATGDRIDPPTATRPGRLIAGRVAAGVVLAAAGWLLSSVALVAIGACLVAWGAAGRLGSRP